MAHNRFNQNVHRSRSHQEIRITDSKFDCEHLLQSAVVSYN